MIAFFVSFSRKLSVILVMLVWRKGNIAFQQCILHSRDDQFFRVGLLDRALIPLGLALSPPSTSVSSDFMVNYVSV